MTTTAVPTVREVTAALDERYPRAWAEQWDRVGPVLGDPDAPVRSVLCVVDVVPETVEQAVAEGASMIVAHHPLLLRPVSSLAQDTFKGRILHRLIRSGIALHTAHTNADVANPGVSDALADRLGLTGLRPLVPAEGAAAGDGRGIGRIGTLPAPMALRDFIRYAAERLPATAGGVRAAGDPDRTVHTVAVSGGSGDGFLGHATRAGVDAYLCADLRHHPAGEHLAEPGPALVDVAHWASEQPWLDDLAAWLRDRFGITALVSGLDTDPWTLHAPSPSKEHHHR